MSDEKLKPCEVCQCYDRQTGECRPRGRIVFNRTVCSDFEPVTPNKADDGLREAIEILKNIEKHHSLCEGCQTRVKPFLEKMAALDEGE